MTVPDVVIIGPHSNTEPTTSSITTSSLTYLNARWRENLTGTSRAATGLGQTRKNVHHDWARFEEGVLRFIAEERRE